MTLYSCGGRDSNPIDGGTSVSVNLDEAKPLMESASDIEGFLLEETEKFPGEILSAVISDKQMILLDGYSSRGVYGYDFNGKQTFVYDKIGQGPDEMLAPVDIQVYGDSIFILDNMASSVIILNPDGTYARRFDSPSYAMSFAVDSIGGLWFDHLNNPSVADGYNLSQKVGSKTISVLEIPENLENVTIGSAHSLVMTDNEVHYMTPMQPYIVRCGNQPEILYHFDFGDKWIPEELCFSGRHPYEIIKDMEKEGYVCDLRFVESAKQLCLSFLSSKIPYYLILDKDSGKTDLYKDEEAKYGHPLGFDRLGRLVLCKRTADIPVIALCRFN